MAGWEMYFTLAVLALEIIGFASNRLRLDVVVLLGLFALTIANVITTKEALGGFGDTVTVMIAATFVLGQGIEGSGLADELAQVLKRGTMGRQWLFCLELMLLAGTLSAFMSNTGTVAIMLPIALSTIKACHWSSRRSLMALAFASSLGGCITIIGTPPNMVVADYVKKVDGADPISFFGFSGIALPSLAVGTLYMCTLGGWILDRTDPERAKHPHPVRHSGNDSADHEIEVDGLSIGMVEAGGKKKHSLGDSSAEDDRNVVYGSDYGVQVVAVGQSKLCGKHVYELGLHAKYGISIMAIGHDTPEGTVAWSKHTVTPVTYRYKLNEHDRLVLFGAHSDVNQFVSDQEDKVRVVKTVAASPDAVLVKLGAVMPPNNNFTLLPIFSEPINTSPQPTDPYFVVSLSYLKRESFHPSEVHGLGWKQACKQLSLNTYTALLAMVFVVVFMFFESLISNPITMMLGATLMCILGCVSAKDAYKAIHWESIVLIAGMIPVSSALEHTGAIQIVVDALNDLGNSTSPWVVLTVLFLLAMTVTQVISNTATAVLIAPVAAKCATAMAVAPQPFLIALALASSNAFMTPVGSPVNILVMQPGGYSFVDYVYVGLPLQIVLFGLCVSLIPLIYPF